MGYCNRYKDEVISRHVDGELPEDESRMIEAHLPDCPHCRSIADSYTLLSESFRCEVSDRIEELTATPFRQTVLHKIRERNTSFSEKHFPGLHLRKFFLQLASIAAIVVAVTVWNQTPPSMQGGPSAIVTSVDAEAGSVMVLETASGNHTIIWYTES